MQGTLGVPLEPVNGDYNRNTDKKHGGYEQDCKTVQHPSDQRKGVLLRFSRELMRVNSPQHGLIYMAKPIDSD